MLDRTRAAPSDGARAPIVGVRDRFARYSVASVLLVPLGYVMLFAARSVWDTQAAVLNLIIGTMLTPPSFLLHRYGVWRGHTGRRLREELLQFWLAVVTGIACSTLTISLADRWFGGSVVAIVVAGLTGQGIAFVGRFLWLDRVTFVATTTPAATSAARRRWGRDR